jgi:hypothetical protein
MIYFLILLLINNVNSQFLRKGFNKIDVNLVKCEEDYNNLIFKSSKISFEDFKEYWNLPMNKICQKVYDKINNIDLVSKEEINPDECKNYYTNVLEPHLKISYYDYIKYLDMSLIDSCETIFNYKI